MPQALTVPASLASLPCWFGLDLGNVSDTTSLCAAWRDDPNARVWCKNWFWMPEETAKQYAAKGAGHWLAWAEDDWLTLIPGTVTDYRLIEDTIKDLGAKVNLREIAVDPWAAVSLTNNLINDGLTVVKIPQTLQHLSPAMKELERQLGAGELRHDGNPVMAWQMANVKCYFDAQGNMRPDKRKSAEKIDGPAALITATARLMVGGGDDGTLYGGTGIALV